MKDLAAGLADEEVADAYDSSVGGSTIS